MTKECIYHFLKITYLISVKKIIGKGEPNFGKLRMRKDEIINLYPNIFKVIKNFNWKPKVSIYKGLKKTIIFYYDILKNLIFNL